MSILSLPLQKNNLLSISKNKLNLKRLSLIWCQCHLLLAKLSFLMTCFFVPLSTTLTDIFFTLTAAFTLLSGGVWQKRKLLWQLPVVKVLLGAVLLILIGFTYTIAPIGQAVLYSKKYLWLLLTPMLFALDIDDRFKSYAIYSFLSAMLITLLFSYLAYFGIIHLFFIKTTDGIFKDHIIQNFLMSITILICLLKTKSIGWQKYIYLFVFFLAAIDILFLCEGRIGYILLPILALYSWLNNYGWKKIYWPCLGLIVLFLIAFHFSSALQQRILITEQNIFSYNFLSLKYSHTSLGIRWTMWDLGVKVISGRPFFGYGTGSIYAVLAKIPDSWVIENEWIRQLNTFESAYLHIGIEFGLIGLFLFFIGGYFLWQDVSLIKENFYQALIKGVMIAMAVGFFFNPWLESTTQKHLFALFLIICLSNRNTAISRKNG